MTETGSSKVLSPVNLVSVRTPPQSSLLPPEAVDPILPPRGFGGGAFPELAKDAEVSGRESAAEAGPPKERSSRSSSSA